MGACCSCWFGEDGENGSGGESGKETEMANRASAAASTEAGRSLAISRAMTAPTIEVENGNCVSGYGLTLVNVVLEQDAGYWEVHIEIPEGSGAAYEVMFGVATKKDRKFYNALQEQEEVSPASNGTDLMRPIPISNGDVVGVAMQQSDLPMVQFLLNGEPLHSLSVNRFRGNVYPSLYLPENEGLTAKLKFAESDFQQLSPHARFGPIIVARGLL